MNRGMLSWRDFLVSVGFHPTAERLGRTKLMRTEQTYLDCFRKLQRGREMVGKRSHRNLQRGREMVGKRSHTRLHLPRDILLEINLSLPAKSVARLRCVSTVWLSITTDPSFILTHARCARKSLIFRSISTKRNNRYYNQLFSFNPSGFSGCRRRLYPVYDYAIGSCDGLILFCRKKAHHFLSVNECYIMNPLTRLHIDLPQSNTSNSIFIRMELYYHRWRGEYRLLYIGKCKESVDFHLDAEVLSLGGTSSSWRQSKGKISVETFFFFNCRIQMTDHLYWAGHKVNQTLPSILVFDILKETFSLMELPSYRQKSAFPSFAPDSFLMYGLVDMEGILCLWFVYRDKNCIKNVMIDIWEAVDGNEKWKNTYSLCLADECRWEIKYPSESCTFTGSCLCIKGRELLFLFTGPRPTYVEGNHGHHEQYLFHWNLKSGKYYTIHLPSGHATLASPALLHRETLIEPPLLSHATLTLTGSPT